MKKLLALTLSLLLVMTMAACNTGKPSSPSTPDPAPGSDSTPPALPADMPWQNVEPLSSPVTLNIGHLANATPNLPTFIASEKGWLKAVGIDVEFVLFKNGPAMTEAAGAGAWDCGSTGIGGIITGVLNQDMKILGVAARDEGGYQAFFARKDSPIVAAGTGHGDVKELYGTADTWRGKEVLCSVGTTNQFLLYKTLANFGLTLNDVKVVNMDSSAANTAFLTGQGDVAGISGALIMSEDKQDYVMVSSDAWAKTGIVTNYVAAPKAWNDKQEAITKWLEIVMMTSEWIQNNPEEAAKYLTAMYDADGYPSTDEANLVLITNNPFSTLDYQKDIVTTNANGVVKMQQQTLDAMAGYVAMGNYAQEQYDAVAKTTSNFLPDAINAIASLHP